LKPDSLLAVEPPSESVGLLADCFAASGLNLPSAGKSIKCVDLHDDVATRLASPALSAPAARTALLLAAVLLVCDRLMGRGLERIGVFETSGLVFGRIDVPVQASVREWLSEIDRATGLWRNRHADSTSNVAARAIEVAVADHYGAGLAWPVPAGFVGPGVVLGIQAPGPLARGWRLVAELGPAFSESKLADLFLAKLELALRYLLEDEDRSLGSFTILSAQEISRLVLWEQGPALQPRPAPRLGYWVSDIVHCFDVQAAQTPNAPAVVGQDGVLSYLELQQRSQAIAFSLLADGVQEGALVPILTMRSADTYAAILAILRCGAGYVPIDPAWPTRRIQALLQEIKAKTLLTVAQIPGTLENSLDGIKIRNLDSGFVAPREVWEAPRLSAQPVIAYVMFTSGSTGAPKGVVIGQGAVIRLVTQAQYLKLDQSTRMLQAAPFGFDASTLEIWGPLLNGGCCVLHPEAIPSARGLAATIRRFEVNTAWLTAALFNSVVDQGAHHLDGLRQLAIGGEALSVAHVRRALAALPEVRLVNGYGPTETTTFACTYDIPHQLADDVTSIPIGFPITATMTCVLNHRFERIPSGFAGELMIGGLGLAEGYLANPELNAARFITVVGLESQARVSTSEQNSQGLRFYRSGDRVRMNETGALEFLGRNDRQIKLRGYRIELSEIDALLATLPGVQAAASMVRHELEPEGQLTAYLVCSPQQFSPGPWRRILSEQLPQAMLPSAWVRLDALPITGNGKLDRSGLPAPSRARSEQDQPLEIPRDTLEAAIVSAFSKVLQIEPVGATDNFFDLGGTSLAVVRTIAVLEEALGRIIPVASFFGHPTPRGIASLLNEGSPMRKGAEAPVDHARVAAHPKVNTSEPIAIVGMAVRLPGADTIEEFWKNLAEGRDSVTRFNLDEIDPSISAAQKNDRDYVAARGVIRDVAGFDAEFFGISPIEAELMDPQQRIFLEICSECMEHAGYGAGSLAQTGSEPSAHSVVRAPAVGVFAGVYNASYFQKHVLSHPDKVADFGEFQVMLANEKDYVATRVAHRLNLTGPAVNVFTACSTSLVAIAQAVDSLRLGRCDAALAGGASITCPPNSGYLYQEGSMLSPDGKTRSFDASAAGTVFSDGAAVVYLKRLSDALADRDTIHAVIRGVAVNNDGGDKASFTAPSVEGQVKVILAAQQEAGVAPQDISYVEAHGTATPMGDPIEVDALRRAFAHHGQCYIGSVKSNIGHTVMAAGAAGVIKTALALSQQKLPKSLHFSSPNPALRLAETGFEVLAEARAWPRTQQPRIAGISSFGVGGTNAHLILQEAPEVDEGPEVVSPQLLKLSARTPDALKAAAARLREHLILNPGISLGDVAHTLETGRKQFAHRISLVAENPADAVARLDPDKLLSGASGKQRIPFKSTVFMFPGQGAQYARMGSTLYQSDRVFRAAMERCFEVLLSRLNLDLRALLFGTKDSVATLSALSQTSLTQPALFVIEYALAQSWIARGLQPTALIGHSVGEFVAATLAGVMSLEDAVYLVARRGSLMQAMPPGRMLAVRQSAESLASSLPAHVTLAVENSPNSIVLAGPDAAIEGYRLVLEARGISARMLETSHAFHSAMMEPAVALFEEELSKVKLHAPTLPLMSTATAKWLSDEEATQTRYWAQHLRLPVMFSSAVSHLLKETDSLFFELGPRSTLTQLVRQQLKPAHASVAISTLGDEVSGEMQASLAATGKLWTVGVPTLAEAEPSSSSDGDEISLTHHHRLARRIPLPSYPFERRRYWLNAAPAVNSPAVTLDARALPQLPTFEDNVTPSTPSSVSRRPQLIQDLAQLFESVSGMDFSQADPEQSFAELGLDSLILTQVSLQIKRKFSIKITFRELMESYRSMNALAEHVERCLPPEKSIANPATALVNTSQMNGAALNSGAGLVGGPAMSSAAATPMPVMADASLTSVFQQQVFLMQQQLELLRLGSGLGGLSQHQPGAQSLSLNASPGSVSASIALDRQAPNSVQPTAKAESEALDGAPDKAIDIQTYDVKKAFGAIARIHTTRSADLSARQLARLDALIARYVARTQASKSYTTRQRGHLADPRVVNGFRPALKEIIYQIVIEKSSGAYLWDIDGNRYVDALNGFGMSLFGWQPPFITEALRQQIELGYEIGPQHPLAGEVARQICDMTGFERAAFCNTGSEAVMGAIRIARTVTGRPLIVSFTGAYHGIFDEVVVRGSKSLRTIPAAPGIMANVGENVLVLEYGSDEALRIIAERSEDIAAVLVEPVQSRRPDFQPKEFLLALRALTERSGIALVFDEVVTGFRAHPGGVQSLFGIRADMATYGKVIGGGLSIGVVAGKREYLDALDGGDWQYGDDSIPTVGVTYFAGTFVRHPLALAAAHVVLKHLKEQGPSLQENLNKSTAGLCAAMNAFCKSRGAPIELRNFASVWKIVFLEDHPYQDLLFAMMRSRGIHILDNFPCFMTTAHQAEDLALILEAFKDSVVELQEATFLPGRLDEAAVTLDANQPPVPGARLGRNRAGQVAWFVENPAQSGQYVEMK
jgi:amino acid adenylation domain-containing protein